MRITEPSGRRFELALERLLEGESFSLDDVSFLLAPDGRLEVYVGSSWRVENTTERRALADLERGAGVVADLAARSPAFAAIAEARPRRFILVHDYGPGSVELCRLEDGRLRWAEGMPPSAGDA